MAEVHERCDHAGGTPGGGRVQRCDRAGARLGALRERRVTAVVARVGVLDYPEYGRAELVTADTIRRVDGLVGRPVVVGHPPPDANGSQLMREGIPVVGRVASARFDESTGEVVAELEITDASVLARISTRELTEVSPGYLAPMVSASGLHEGRRYDSVQGEREWDHVALLPPGGARCGAACSCRVDGDSDLARHLRAFLERNEMDTERIDGIEYKIGSPEWRQAHTKRMQRVDEEKAEAEKAKAKADADLEAMKAERDALRAKLAELEKKLEAAESPEAMDARADARAQLLEVARRVLGADAKLERTDEKGGTRRLSNDELKRAVIAKVAPDVDLTKATQAYVDAYFDFAAKHMVAASAEPSGPFFTPAPATPKAPGAPRVDAPDLNNQHTLGREPPPSLEDAYRRR